MSEATGIEWTDSTWSPIRVRVKENAAEIARARGYTSLVQIAEKMSGRVGQHCEHVSPGCLNCYAGANNHRCLPANGTGLPYDRRSRDLVDVFVDEEALLKPLKWDAFVEHSAACELAAAERREARLRRIGCDCPMRRRRIFVENQSDLFAEWVTDEMLDQVHAVMVLCPQHDFQTLTKRPELMVPYLGSPDRLKFVMLAAGHIVSTMFAGNSFSVKRIVNLLERLDAKAENIGERVKVTIKNVEWPLPNAWRGVSVEDQATANARIPLLQKAYAPVLFISAEPLVGSVDIGKWIGLECHHETGTCGTVCANCEGMMFLDWVIAGGESGSHARPMHPDWSRGLRDQCKAVGVPFFFKQWGEWAKHTDRDLEDPDWRQDYSRMRKSPKFRFLNVEGGQGFHGRRLQVMQRVGKKAAGALLDGVEYRQMPEVRL